MRTANGGSVGRAALVAIALGLPVLSLADQVAVKHREGLTHGFVALRTLEGTPLADGDLIETTAPTSSGNRVTSQLTLHFKDGSLHQETTVFMQRKTFQFVSDQVVQKGPAFKTQIESTVSASGQVTVRYSDEDGKEKTIQERVKLPPDTANGMIMTLLKNISPKTPKTTVSMVALTPKAQLVNLEIVPQGEEHFSTGASPHLAMHYVVKVHVPGLTGAVASLLGKIPPDSHVWVHTGDAPAFVKAELALFPGGPMWRLELLSPVWPAGSSAPKESTEAKKELSEAKKESSEAKKELTEAKKELTEAKKDASEAKKESGEAKEPQEGKH
jgi:hypothetical protein